MIDLIDRSELLAQGFPTIYHTEFCDEVINTEDIKNAPTVKAFTRSELEGWLYEIYNNNIDGSLIDRVFAENVEEIISRLDGFEKYVEDIRREAST